jgi:hypothetical protein
MREERDMGTFEKPTIRDYGTLVELTAAVEGCNAEDSGSKSTRQHHTDPSC